MADSLIDVPGREGKDERDRTGRIALPCYCNYIENILTIRYRPKEHALVAGYYRI